ncbi:MAG TPA: hypothetical protein VFJ90_07985, partial [Candidatus Didemnitutus sp.]|nr:hypothetical protein [Candidatus Didemnitutus sp.]
MAQLNCISTKPGEGEIGVPAEITARPSWHEAAVSDHFVQFFPDDESLVAAGAGFIGAGLRAVEGGIILAAAPHREAIARRLIAQGIDLQTAFNRQQFISLDVEATLATFMVDDMPDERLFHRTVGHVITRMLSAG